MQRSLEDIFSGNGNAAGISELIKKTDQIKQVQQIFNSVLPDEFTSQVIFATYREGVITAITPNAVMATQLRIQQNTILEQLRRYKEFQYAYQIKAKVSPVIPRSRKNDRAPVISKKNAELLRQEARLCNDEDIAEVYASLARHGE